jgi:hypothetical protein
MSSDPGSLRWRYYSSREVGAARAWAKAGGIAVHENIFKSRGRRTCHLLASDEVTLIAAAVAVGCSPWWIQRTRTVHFDLVEVYLERALGLCAAAGAATDP